MADKGSAGAASAAGGSVASKSSKKGKTEVPYGSAYSKDQQKTQVQDKVTNGLKELMSLVKDGTQACVDRAVVIEHATKLERQAEKIQEAVIKDTVFIEEVRHHHNRISDLCDNTRAYTHEQMVADLKRAAAIRVNVMTIVQGKPPEFELEQEELDELKSVRLMLRRRFGAKNRAKGDTTEQEIADQSGMAEGMPGSNVKAKLRASQKGFLAGEEMDAEELRAPVAVPGSWTAGVVEDMGGRK